MSSLRVVSVEMMELIAQRVVTENKVGLKSAGCKFGVAGALGVMAVMVMATPAFAQVNMSKAGEKLDGIEAELSKIESRFLGPQQLETEFPLESRFNDAVVAYRLGQYDRASFLFIDILSRTNKQSFGGYRATLFYLGDSLFQQRNYVGARGYLKELMGMGRGEFYEDALNTLLEIAYRTDSYDGLDEIYRELEVDSTPASSYLRGKVLFQQGRFDDARAAFERSAQSEEFTLKGTYFAGVALVSAGKLAEAEELFKKVVKSRPKGDSALEIYNLGFLSLGRLSYEQERHDEAISWYNRVEGSDASFVRAQYELAWVNISKDDLVEAEQIIDILVLGEPNNEIYTKALLLRANLALRNKNYDKAVEDYAFVSDQYNPAKEAMDKFVAEHQDLRGFFLSIVADDLTLNVPAGLPVLRENFTVVRPEVWLNRGGELTKTRTLVSDVSSTREDLEQARLDLDLIERRLDSSARLSAFPKIAQGITLVVGLETDLVTVKRLIVDRQAELVASKLAGGDEQAWQALSRDLGALERQYAEIPGTSMELKKRSKKVDEQFALLRTELVELGYELDRQRAELLAIESYMETEELTITPEERAEVAKMRDALEAAIKELEDDQRALRTRIDIERAEQGAGDLVSGDEREVRRVYSSKLGEASAFLSSKGSSSELSQLQGLMGRVGALEARVVGYYSKSDQLVDAQVAEIRKTVANLRGMVDMQSKELDAMAESSRQVAGYVAFKTFIEKRDEISSTVLRSDIGLIDVMYIQKEAATTEINSLFRQRTDELRALQEAFEDLR